MQVLVMFEQFAYWIKKWESLIYMFPISFQYPSHSTWISAEDREWAH